MKRYQWISNQHIPLVTNAFKASQLPHNPRVFFKALISFVVNRTHLFQNGWTAFWMRVSGNGEVIQMKEIPKNFIISRGPVKWSTIACVLLKTASKLKQWILFLFFPAFLCSYPMGCCTVGFNYCLSSATKTSSSPSFSAKSTSQKQIREKNQRC